MATDGREASAPLAQDAVSLAAPSEPSSEIISHWSRQLRLEFAALCVLKAVRGDAPDTVMKFDSAELQAKLKAYAIRHRFRFLRRGALCLLVVLIAFEQPRWCCGVDRPACSDHRYFGSNIPFLSNSVALALECLGVGGLCVDFALWFVALGWRHVRHDPAKVGHLCILGAMATEALLQVVGVLSPCSWSPSHYFRVTVLLFYNPGWLQEQTNFILGAKDMLKLIFLMELFVAVSAWFAVMLFQNTGLEGNLYNNIGNAFWNLQVLLTTNNFPDVMIVQYSSVRAAGLFFVAFVVIGLFLLLQMLVAFVCDTYLSHRKEFASVVHKHQRALLDEAFVALDFESNGWVGKQRLFSLLETLNQIGYMEIGDNDRRSMLFAVLDQVGNNQLSRQEFSHLARSLGIRFSKVPTPWLQDAFPALWERCRCDELRTALKSDAFQYAMIFVFVVYALLSVKLSWPLLVGSGHRMFDSLLVHMADYSLGTIYLLETSLKILTYGWHDYWDSWKCRFDLLTTIGMIFACILLQFDDRFGNRQTMQLANVLGICRIFTLVFSVPAFRNMMLAVKAIGRGVGFLLPGFLIRLMLFSVLGCDLFGGLIATDADAPGDIAKRLGETIFGQSGYHALNFNDHLSGLMLLFACLVMNNWNTYTDAFVAVFGPLARGYFVFWWFAGVLTGLNLVIAVALTAIIKEFGSLDKGGQQVTHGYAEIEGDVITGTSTGVSGKYRVSLLPSEDDLEATTADEVGFLKSIIKPSNQESVRDLDGVESQPLPAST